MLCTVSFTKKIFTTWKIRLSVKQKVLWKKNNKNLSQKKKCHGLFMFQKKNIFWNKLQRLQITTESIPPEK